MSKFQDSVAKPRTSSSHKNLLDGGRKDLIKHGQPFNQARPVDKSNAFLAKEEHEDDLEEVSAMGAGAVAGHVGQSNKKKKKEGRNSTAYLTLLRKMVGQSFLLEIYLIFTLSILT